MRASLRHALFAGFIGITCGACERDHEAEQACALVKEQYGFEKGDFERCLRDLAFRAEARAKLDREYARFIADGINKNKDVLLNKSFDSTSAQTVSAPDQLANLELEDRSDLGKIYKVTGTISAAAGESLDDPLETVFLAIDGYRSASADELGEAPVSLHKLNDYQTALIKQYCDLYSACHGTIYVQIAKDPEGVLIGTELLSAELDSVTEEDVLKTMSAE